MNRGIIRILTPACVFFLIFAIVGCTKTLEEQVAIARAQYTITLSDVSEDGPDDPPSAPENAGATMMAEAAESTMEAGEEAAEGEEGGEGEGEGEEMENEGPRSTNVLFDLVVHFRGKKALDGITVDVTHADEFEDEKGVYQQYIETAGMINGETRQVDFTLEGMTVEDGDAFSVTLASGVPADLSNYPEFSEPAP